MHGREFALLDRRMTWGEERVYYRDDTGAVKRMPASWTSLGTVDAFVVVSKGKCDLRVQDLLELAAIVERLRQASKKSRSK